MHDDLSEEVAVFDFEELANHLLEQGLDASPSQLHGCVSGLLAAGAPDQPEYGLDALAQSLDLVVYGELAGRVMQLYTATADALLDEAFSFYLLLPDDDQDIAARTEALAQWCKGFLVGFAQISAGVESPRGALSDDSGEILRDIAAIAEAAADEEEDEEDSEDSYMELVEYLRFAVLNVFMDSQAISREASAPEEQPPVH